MYFLDMLVAVGPLGAILLLAIMAPSIPFTSAGSFEDLNCEGIIGGGEFANVKVEEDVNCFLSGVKVHGNVQSDGAEFIKLLRTEVDGNVQIKKTSGGITIERSFIGGNVQIEDNQIKIGGDSNFILDTEIGGNLQFSKNYVTRGLGHVIAGNTINGDLQCFYNTPAPNNLLSGPNDVTGNQDGQCSRLLPN